MEARGSVVSKARLIRRVSTSCVIDELLEEFVRLFSEVTTAKILKSKFFCEMPRYNI